MPRAEANLKPKNQAYGQGVAQQAVEQAGAQAAAPTFQPSGVPATSSAVPAEVRQILGAATDRPEEPVTAGLARFMAQRSEGLDYWLPLLDELSASPDASPYVRELAARARIASGREQ